MKKKDSIIKGIVNSVLPVILAFAFGAIIIAAIGESPLETYGVLIRKSLLTGEPQGTAGMPALNVLQKEELTDCVLVVTRYFGGILLGGGGLVRAYSHAAKIAVDAGGIVTRAECSIVKIRCDYTFYGRLASLIPEQGGIVEDTAFEDVVTVKMRIPQELEPAFEARLVDLSNGTCRGEITDTVFADID